jgi:hypothetical protein
MLSAATVGTPLMSKRAVGAKSLFTARRNMFMYFHTMEFIRHTLPSRRTQPDLLGSPKPTSNDQQFQESSIIQSHIQITATLASVLEEFGLRTIYWITVIQKAILELVVAVVVVF